MTGGSGNVVVPDGANGMTLYKYDAFKKTSLSRSVDIKPITADFTNGRGQRIPPYLVRLNIFKKSTNISLVIRQKL